MAKLLPMLPWSMDAGISVRHRSPVKLVHVLRGPVRVHGFVCNVDREGATGAELVVDEVKLGLHSATWEPFAAGADVVRLDLAEPRELGAGAEIEITMRLSEPLTRDDSVSVRVAIVVDVL